MNTVSDAGLAMHAFMAQLYPICRSITGNGVRQTLRLVGQHIPIKIYEVPSGTQVFDWEVPLEWNIEDASISDLDGRRVVDFQRHNLHLVSYSEPLSCRMPLSDLRPHLHVHANADWIPYRTSYYRRNWGFCMRGRDLAQLPEGQYDVHVQSSLAKGALTYGEVYLPGATREEVLFFTHICHPSLANDNAAGISLATSLASWLAQSSHRYSYRLVFAPGTIGSLCWLKKNEKHLGRIRNGLVLGLLGDSAPLTYKYSRRGDAEIDTIVPYVLNQLEPDSRVVPFEPYGYDERQLCSPGFNLPVGRLTRSANDGYPQYHSSADDLELVKPWALQRSLEACQRIVEVIESDRSYVNLSPKGEPRLGKRGLYGAVGGQSPAVREHSMLWVLNQSDGTKSLLDIAQKSGIDFAQVTSAAQELADAGLLREAHRVSGRAAAKRAVRKPRPVIENPSSSPRRLKTAKRSRRRK